MDKEVLREFIERYKFHTCLWDRTSSDYTNKMRRVNALHDLASVLGDSVSIDTVRRRIDILRNGFKREYKKVVTSTINSTSASDIYVPTLWYYEQMLFLEDSEQAIENSTEYLHQDEENYFATTSNQNTSFKKRKHENKPEKDKFITTEQYFVKDRDSSEIFGKYIGMQLQTIRADQRIIAEKLMSDVLYLARNNKLSESTTVLAHSLIENDDRKGRDIKLLPT